MAGKKNKVSNLGNSFFRNQKKRKGQSTYQKECHSLSGERKSEKETFWSNQPGKGNFKKLLDLKEI